MRIAGVDQRVTFYSLDVIISVGYRVKSNRGVLFRQWANSILKQYLLNGHVINEERCLSCASNIISLQNDIKHIESKIITNEDIHGRYLFIDDIGYIIDNSFNNIGKKRLLMMKLEDTKERILKGII